MQRGPVVQDWEPVVFKKNISKDKPKTSNAPGTKKYNELDGDEIVAPTYVTQEQAQFLIEARNAKGLKQQELAKQCNIDVSIIRDIENRKAIFNKKMYSNLLRKLGVKITTQKDPNKN